MDLLAALDMLARSAEERGFSAAARRLGVTPAAVSKQVARLERELGVRLVVRSTRSLSLTEAGARLVDEALPGLQCVQAALQAAQRGERSLAGVLRISVAPAFGRRYVLPAVAAFVAGHPALRIDWHFDNRQVDLIGEGFDVGIAGGVKLAGGLVARPLVPLHLVLVASPGYLARAGEGAPRTPQDLQRHAALVLRSPSTGRARSWALQRRSRRVTVQPVARMWVGDPEALADAALAGYGIALAGMPHVAAQLREGSLVRVLPGWWADAGSIAVYFPPGRQLPGKTRAFVDHLVAAFEASGLRAQLRADLA